MKNAVAQIEAEEFSQLNRLVSKSVRPAWIEPATALLKIHREKLWKQKHQSFSAYCKAIGIGRSWAYTQITAAEVIQQLES